MQTGHRILEREITDRTNLCLPDGRLNREAVGWSRTPLHHTNLLGWGRTMRWAYWCVVTPTHLFAITASQPGLPLQKGPLVPGPPDPGFRGVSFPDRCGEGSVWLGAGENSVSVEEVPGNTRLRVIAGELKADLRVQRIVGRDSLAVVVPWSDRRFQYTVKDVGRPVEGTLTVRGEEIPVSTAESVATLDHARAAGRTTSYGTGGRRTPPRRPGDRPPDRWQVDRRHRHRGERPFLDGRLHKISEELVWRYDSQDWYAPWQISGERVDLEFHPQYVRSSDTTRLWMRSREDQAFGRIRRRRVHRLVQPAKAPRRGQSRPARRVEAQHATAAPATPIKTS